jgi:hypothetical protein
VPRPHRSPTCAPLAGTYVSLDLADVHGPLECELIAVSKTGERRVVTGWTVGVPGDGTWHSDPEAGPVPYTGKERSRPP